MSVSMKFEYSGRWLEFSYLEGKEVRTGCRSVFIHMSSKNEEELLRAEKLMLEEMGERGWSGWSGFDNSGLGENYESSFSLEVSDPEEGELVKKDYKEAKKSVLKSLKSA